MRICTACKRNLPLAAFDVADKKSGRLRGDCKKCVWEKQKARYALDREKWAEIRLTANRKHRYGVTRQQVNSMLAEQNNSCGICRSPITYMTAHLDHCHETSKVRGLLCPDCNRGLGHFKDDVTRLKNAINYLRGG